MITPKLLFISDETACQENETALLMPKRLLSSHWSTLWYPQHGVVCSIFALLSVFCHLVVLKYSAHTHTTSCFIYLFLLNATRFSCWVALDSLELFITHSAFHKIEAGISIKKWVMLSLKFHSLDYSVVHAYFKHSAYAADYQIHAWQQDSYFVHTRV